MQGLLKNTTIATRVALGTIIVLLLAIAVLAPLVLHRTEQVVAAAEQRTLSGLFSNFEAAIAAEARMAESMSALVSQLPEVGAAVASGDRARLAQWFDAGFAALKREYGFSQFQFHLPPATSFYRVHKPSQFGDDLSGFRATVVETNRTGRPVRGLESGVAGLGIRGIYPVSNDGVHVGSVEFGSGMGQAFFEQFKQTYGVDMSLRLVNQESFETFASTLDHALLPDTLTREVFDGATVTRAVSLRDAPGVVYARRVLDYSGAPIGVLEIAMDRTESLSMIADTRNLIILVTLAMLLAGTGLAWLIARGIVTPINASATALKQIADGDGDLTRRIDADGADELARLGQGVNRFMDQITEIVRNVRAISGHVASAAREIAAGNDDLAIRNEEQASATEETVATIEQMSGAMRQTADNAQNANQLVGGAREQTEAGRRIAADAIAAMSTLETSSDRIGDIIVIIDEIAFQTNLLALNASVEAAHAGEHGRGFAVVANEVRELAGRSAEAAREIKTLIQESHGRVRESVTRVERFGQVLDAVSEQIGRMSGVVAEIASSAAQQSGGIDDVRRAINQIEAATMQNTALVEQISAASHGMAEQAARLDQQVGRFRLAEAGAAPAASAASRPTGAVSRNDREHPSPRLKRAA